MSKFKNITHVFAVVLAAATTFIASPAGQSLVHQYPVLSPVVMGIVAIAGVYHTPLKG